MTKTSTLSKSQAATIAEIKKLLEASRKTEAALEAANKKQSVLLNDTTKDIRFETRGLSFVSNNSEANEGLKEIAQKQKEHNEAIDKLNQAIESAVDSADEFFIPLKSQCDDESPELRRVESARAALLDVGLHGMNRAKRFLISLSDFVAT